MGCTGATPCTGPCAALISALIIGLVSICARQREDTVISAVWPLAWLSGSCSSPNAGYVDPMSYLFATFLLLSRKTCGWWLR